MTETKPAARHNACPRILVIQPGTELECALTRGWVDALKQRAEVETVARAGYSELLDVGRNPADWHALPTGLLGLWQLRRTLHGRFDRVLCLGRPLPARLLATVCPPAERIGSTVGTASCPPDIDAQLGVLFARVGVKRPQRNGLTLTRQTREAAKRLLAGFGFGGADRPVIVAVGRQSQNALLAQCDLAAPFSSQPPVVLLPHGTSLDSIGSLGGRAYLVAAPDPALRAALIANAAILLGDHAPSSFLAALLRVPVHGGSTSTYIPADARTAKLIE